MATDRPDAARADTPDATCADARDAVLRRAEALLPSLRERAAATEALRRLPTETEAAFHENGLFRVLQPARVGGAELDYGILIDLGAIIARACPSSSWNLTNLLAHHWMLALFEPEVQDEVWGPDPDVLIAASLIFPAGKARAVDGGYVISGRWPFASGIDPSEWTMLGGIVAETDPPEHRMFILPRRDYEIIDTWHATALRGTGSNDVAAEEVFVPAHRTLAVDETKGCRGPGLAVNDAALYRLPVFAMFPYVLAGCALGTAEGALEGYVAATRRRVGSYSGARVADHVPIQIKIAEAAVRIEAASTLMRAACDEAMAHGEAGTVPDFTTKTRFRRNGAYAASECRRAVDILFEASGGAALYEHNPIQRFFRDIHAINAHISFNFDIAGAQYGRAVLGLEEGGGLL